MNPADAALQAWLRDRAELRGARVAISGAQATGKSYRADRFAAESGLKVARMSLDDVYLTGAARRRRAAQAHPLFATRGPPGTHDLALWDETLTALAEAGGASRTRLPRFDKLADERVPAAAWPVFAGAPDLVLLDGWCLGATPLPVKQLGAPVNDLERDEDPDGTWRRAVNDALAGDYARRFDAIDAFVFLAAPSFATAAEWRRRAERAAVAAAGASAAADLDRRIARFVRHFERITRSMLAGRRRPGAAAILDATRTLTAFVANGGSVTDKSLAGRGRGG